MVETTFGESPSGMQQDSNVRKWTVEIKIEQNGRRVRRYAWWQSAQIRGEAPM